MSSKFALIIGNSQYQDPNLAKLVAPTEDVSDLAVVLRDQNIGGFDSVLTLNNEADATIRLSIEDFFAEKKPDDLLVLYFSGHGVRDEQGKLYLAAPNTRANRLRATAIAADFVTSEMDRSRSKRQVLILDCCHSGAFAQGSKAVAGGSVGTGPAFEGTGYGRVVLTATDATQYAWEGDKIIGEAENSVFTHYLVQGLQTGEADLDADGRISLDELYDYVYGQVVAKTPKQTPGKWSYRQQGDIVIAKNPRPIVKPSELPIELKQAIESPFASVREGVVRELDRLLNGSNAGLSLAAFDALKQLVDDDSRRVSATASASLAAYAEKQRAREELAKQRAEEERLAKEKAEQERLAKQRAEQERLAREVERAEQERLTKEKAEAERLAALKAEQERLARQRAEEERIAREVERTEQERLTKEKAEAERLAALKAEQERLAREAQRAEEERIAREAEQAEQERLAKEKAEAERLAALKAEEEQTAHAQIAIEDITDTAERIAVPAPTAGLIVKQGADAGKSFALKAGSNIIGRVSGLDITIADTLISRRHVRITALSDRVVLEDLGSANGTFVNNQRISGTTPITLNDGDSITIGDTTFEFKATAIETPVKPIEPQPIEPTQPETIIVVPTSTISTAIARPTIVTALGFGVTWAIAFALFYYRRSDDPLLYIIPILAAIVPWCIMGWAMRRMRVPVKWRHIIGWVFGWGISIVIGGFIITVMGRIGLSVDLVIGAVIFGAIFGLLGGAITSAITKRIEPSLRSISTRSIAIGWSGAWAIGLAVGLSMSLSSPLSSAFALAVAGAIVGVMGSGVTFWQIARVRGYSSSPQVSDSKPVTALPLVSLLSGKAQWRPFAIIGGGWVAGWIGGVLIDLIISLGPLAMIGSWAIAGLCSGLILRRSAPAIERKHISMLAIGWPLILALGMGLQSKTSDYETAIYLTLGVAAAGWITTLALRPIVPAFQGWQPIVAAVDWGIAWAIIWAAFNAPWNIIAFKYFNYGWTFATISDAERIYLFSLLLGMIVHGLAGGGILFWLFDRTRHSLKDPR